MNQIEQAKIKALQQCRMGWGAWDAGFVNSLAAQMTVDSHAALSLRQKFELDKLVFRYRRQLAGKTGFELPAEAPRETDYVPSVEGQGALFT